MSLSDKIENTIGKLNQENSNNAQGSQQPNAQSAQDNSSVQPKEFNVQPAKKVSKVGSSFSLNLETLRDYVVTIVGFVVALFITFLVIIPQFNKISEHNATYTRAQSQLAEVSEQANYLESLVGLKEELESNVELASQSLPSTEDRVPYVLDQILQIADDSGVIVESLNLSGISEPEEGSTSGLRDVLIQASVSGPINQVSDFFGGLESARTLIDVSSFQVSSEVSPQNQNNTIQRESGEIIFTNTDLIKVSFALKSYLKPESQTTTVNLSALANSPDYGPLFRKLKDMEYYEPREIDVELGRDNPFGVSESTPSATPVDEEDQDTDTETNTVDESSGIE